MTLGLGPAKGQEGVKTEHDSNVFCIWPLGLGVQSLHPMLSGVEILEQKLRPTILEPSIKRLGKCWQQNWIVIEVQGCDGLYNNRKE